MNNFPVVVTKVREIVLEDKTSFRSLTLEQLVPTVSKTTGRTNLYPMRATITVGLSKEAAEKLVGTEVGGKLVKRELPAEKHRDWTSPDGVVHRITTENIWQVG